MILSIVFILSLCFGSFLNVVSYRLTNDKPFFAPRSQCPHCGCTLAWYDLIPLLSWIGLWGACRKCSGKISVLYPLIELVTAVVMTGLFYTVFSVGYGSYNFSNSSLLLFTAYAFCVSALICATRSDLEALVIPQIFSLWLVPVGIFFAALHATHLSVSESCAGAALGYGLLWLVGTLFKYFTKKDGLGEGDSELLAMIGSFLGFAGVWSAVTIGSFTGLFVGLFYIFLTKRTTALKIPFGPFLSLGALMYIFFGDMVFSYLFFWKF